MTTDNDYWPSDLLDNIPSTPRQVMESAASQLGPKTRNLVLAEIHTRTNAGEGFYHDFYLRVPSLKYRYDLFTVHHDISLYPVTLVEFGDQEFEDEKQFDSFIRERINSPETIKTVRSLIAQAVEEDSIPF